MGGSLFLLLRAQLLAVAFLLCKSNSAAGSFSSPMDIFLRLIQPFSSVPAGLFTQTRFAVPTVFLVPAGC